MSDEDRVHLRHIAEWGGLQDPDSLLRLGQTGSSLAFNLEVQRPELLPQIDTDPGVVGATLLIARLRELHENVQDREVWTSMAGDLSALVVDEWETLEREQGPWKQVWDFHFDIGRERGWLVGVLQQIDGMSSEELARFSAGVESGSIKLPEQRSKSGCYIATAVYGNYDCPQVRVLRRFRDDVLVRSPGGRGLVRAYYATSPKMLKCMPPAARPPLRRLLDSAAIALKKRGFSDLPYVDVPLDR